MNKTARQRRHEEKNWRAQYQVLTKPYMIPHFRHRHKKPASRFKLALFRQTVISIIILNRKYALFGGRCASYVRNAKVEFPHVKISVR